MPTPSESEMQKAMALSKKIIDKAFDALAPLEREMRVMKWKPEYRRIMWEAVAMEAAKRARDADAE